MGRRALFKTAMSAAERMRRMRAKRRLAARPPVAHTKQTQRRHAIEAAADCWSATDLNLSRAKVCPVSLAEARTIIEQFEPMPAQSRQAFGLFFGSVLGGAVVFSDDYGANLGVWSKYGYDGKLILLSRGACLHWTPKNSASRLVRGSMDLLPPRFEVVTATVDFSLGEVGTIYQAAGFVFVEMKTKGGKYVVGTRGSRSLRHDGIMSKRDIELRGLKPNPQPAKGRYFAFRGPGARQHREAIAHLIAPYPKRRFTPTATMPAGNS